MKPIIIKVHGLSQGWNKGQGPTGFPTSVFLGGWDFSLFWVPLYLSFGALFESELLTKIPFFSGVNQTEYSAKKFRHKLRRWKQHNPVLKKNFFSGDSIPRSFVFVLFFTYLDYNSTLYTTNYIIIVLQLFSGIVYVWNLIYYL